MKTLDRILQILRIRQAKKYIYPGAYVLDIGCFDGSLFKQLGGFISGGVGIDPLLSEPQFATAYTLLPGRFPDDLPAYPGAFDCVVALAVVEHIPPEDKQRFVSACLRVLKSGGKVIITVPSLMVDRILDLLLKLKLVDGMSLEEHHGFLPESVSELFRVDGFKLLVIDRFQWGLNYCYVFQKEG